MGHTVHGSKLIDVNGSVLYKCWSIIFILCGWWPCNGIVKLALPWIMKGRQLSQQDVYGKLCVLRNASSSCTEIAITFGCISVICIADAPSYKLICITYICIVWIPVHWCVSYYWLSHSIPYIAWYISPWSKSWHSRHYMKCSVITDIAPILNEQ